MPGLEAGRELDALVAEKIFGSLWRAYRSDDEEKSVIRLFAPSRADYCEEIQYKNQWGTSSGFYPTDYPDLPAYSTDIAAAWEVVEKVGTGWLYLSLLQDSDKVAGYWRAAFHRLKETPQLVDADTAPLAICLAALKAVGVEVPE